MNQPRELQLDTGSQIEPLHEASEDVLQERVQLGNIVREKLFEEVRSSIAGKLSHPKVVEALRLIEHEVPHNEIDILISRTNVTLSERALLAEDTDAIMFHAAIDIAKQKPSLQQEMHTLTEEKDVQATLALIKIANVANSVFVEIANIFARSPAQKDSLHTKQNIVHLSEEAYRALQKNYNQDVSYVHENDVSEHTDNTSVVQDIIRAEAQLASSLEELTSIKNERMDRLVLFRKIASNIRKNANAFFQPDMKLELRINQLDALGSLIQFLENEGNGDRIGYFKQPTGSGKTVLYGALARLMNVKTLILTPRTNLLTQTQSELMEMIGIPTDEIGLVGDKRSEIGRKYTIATYHSHISRMNSDTEYMHDVQQCELVICDEAHKSLGKETQNSIYGLDGEYDEEMNEEDELSEKTVIENIETYTSTSALKLGFTATPTLVVKSVQEKYKTLIAESFYSDLIRAGILNKFKVKQVEVHIKPGDVTGHIGEQQESQLLEREKVYEALLTTYKESQTELDERLLGLATCANIAECDKFAQIAEKLGLRCTIVTNREYNKQSHIDHKAVAEQQLLDDVIDIIVTVEKLKEGWNFKPLNAVILARATLSPANILQPAGRASRAYKDQQFAYIFEAKWRSAQAYEKEDRESESSGSSTNSSRKNRTFSAVFNRPITFADALYLTGEKDIHTTCEGWHGEHLRYKHIYTLDQNGEVIIDGIVCVGINRYCDIHHLDATTLRKHIRSNEITKIATASTNKHRASVDVYDKSQIEELPYVQKSMDTGQLHTKEIKSNNGVAIIDEQECVTVHYFLSELFGNRPNTDKLRSITEKANLPIMGYSAGGGGLTPLYNTKQLRALPYIQKRLDVHKQLHKEQVHEETGIISINETVCVASSVYGRHMLGSNGEKILLKLILENNVSHFAYAKSVSQDVPVYTKNTIDALIKEHILPKVDALTAEITIKDIVCVTLQKYADLYFTNTGERTNTATLRDAVRQAGIPIIGNARSGSRIVPAYPKSAIEALPYVIKRKV